MGHGYSVGEMNGFKEGVINGEGYAEYKIANEMRVILCALITAHKREDSNAFLGNGRNSKDRCWKICQF